jgi:hypothetical protein
MIEADFIGGFFVLVGASLLIAAWVINWSMKECDNCCGDGYITTRRDSPFWEGYPCDQCRAGAEYKSAFWSNSAPITAYRRGSYIQIYPEDVAKERYRTIPVRDPQLGYTLEGKQIPRVEAKVTVPAEFIELKLVLSDEPRLGRRKLDL